MATAILDRFLARAYVIQLQGKLPPTVFHGSSDAGKRTAGATATTGRGGLQRQRQRPCNQQSLSAIHTALGVAALQTFLSMRDAQALVLNARHEARFEFVDRELLLRRLRLNLGDLPMDVGHPSSTIRRRSEGLARASRALTFALRSCSHPMTRSPSRYFKSRLALVIPLSYGRTGLRKSCASAPPLFDSRHCPSLTSRDCPPLEVHDSRASASPCQPHVRTRPESGRLSLFLFRTGPRPRGPTAASRA